MSVLVTSGANELRSASYVGKSIEEVRRELKTPLNIGPEAEVRLNSEPCTNHATILRAGDEVEFCKEAGTKGR